MNRFRPAFCCVLTCCVVTCLLLLSGIAVYAPAAHAQDQSGRKVLGIMPVFDSSGEEYGEQFAQNLTAMVFHKLDGALFDVMLLNPGGLYNPLIPESLVDYAQSANVNTVLIMSFLQTTKPQKGDYTLNVEVKLMDAATGKLGEPSAFSYIVNRHELSQEIANSGLDIVSAASSHVHAGRDLYKTMGSSANKAFEKQPLGKGALTMADQIRTMLLTQVPPSTVKATPVKLGTCTYTVQVKYVSKKAVSKAYDIILNGEEESLWTKEGVTTLENKPSGPIFLQVGVADAPYRLAVQDMYQANTVLDCAKPERQLFLEIGAGGDALLVWR
jgi:hypothetical protein